MSFGGTSRTVSEPWGAQKPYLEAAFKRARDLYNKDPDGPEYWQGPTKAGFDPAQQASQMMRLNYGMGNRSQNLMRGAEHSLMQGLSGRVDTKAYDPLMDALGSKVLGQLQNKILPSLRDEGFKHHPGGSSRTRQMRDKAVISGTLKGLGVPMAEQYGNAYNTAQNRAVQSLSMYPGTMMAPFGLADQVGGVGAERQGMTQQALNDAMAKDQYEKNAPYQALDNYQNSISGNYGGTQTQTAPTDMFGSIMALGQLASLFPSDIRIKENIVSDGTWKGHNVYRYNFIGKDVRCRGVMAQEVEQTRPDAVVEIDGIKHVNYGAL